MSPSQSPEQQAQNKRAQTDLITSLQTDAARLTRQRLVRFGFAPGSAGVSPSGNPAPTASFSPLGFGTGRFFAPQN